MYGNLRYNIITGAIGFVLVFLLALSSNPLITALFRGIYGFIAFFIIAFLIRFVLGQVMNPKQDDVDTILAQAEEITGQNIDYVATEKNENLNDLLKNQLTQSVPVDQTNISSAEQPNSVETNEGFKPLKPTQLFSNKEVQPEEMSKAIRHLTGE